MVSLTERCTPGAWLSCRFCNSKSETFSKQGVMIYFFATNIYLSRDWTPFFKAPTASSSNGLSRFGWLNSGRPVPLRTTRFRFMLSGNSCSDGFLPHWAQNQPVPQLLERLETLSRATIYGDTLLGTSILTTSGTFIFTFGLYIGILFGTPIFLQMRI
jgi:hypothetical protein